MTRTGAIVFTWGAPVRGREMKGLEVFGEALQYYEELSKEGRIIAHREYFNTAADGGMMIIEGLLSELHLLVQDDEFLRLQQRASAIVEDFRREVVAGGSDQTVQQLVTMYTESLADLGLA
ncbi:MAG TPA: hypothetical protein VI916_02165 [Acidimicrobiia bacterium]|nr:hypothetical protein [Acidimicrobiia bacterium]